MAIKQKEDRMRWMSLGLMGMILAIGMLFLVGECFARSNIDNTTESFRHHMATKSSYWSDPALGLPTGSVDAPPAQCKAVFVNLLARHGTRYPTSSDITKLNSLQSKIQQFSAFFAPQYAWLKDWTNPFQPVDQGLLVAAGEEELYDLAQRLQTRFSPLLSQEYKPYRYVYQTTQIPRAAMSGQSFGYSLNQNSGILGSARFNPFFSYSDSVDQDFDLRFFDNCPIYLTSVKNNDSTSEQQNKFDDAVIKPMGIQFAKNLGVFPQWQVSVADLKSFWRMCAYDLSIYNITDRFCTLFNASQVYELEYSSDISSYYENGYGNAINYQSACPLLKDFVNRTDALICGNDVNMVAKYRFAHAETVMPLVALLGLYKDPSPLMADWSPQKQAARLWKSGSISPYAANVVLVLYNCGDSYSVKALVNEVEVVLPGCPNVLCPYSTFKTVYGSSISCSFVSMCFPSGETPCGYPPESDFVVCPASSPASVRFS